MTDSAKPMTASEREALVAHIEQYSEIAGVNALRMAAELSRLAKENESQAQRIEYLEGLAINTSADNIWHRKNRELEGAAITDAALCLRESPLGGRCSKPLGHDTHDCGPLLRSESHQASEGEGKE